MYKESFKCEVHSFTKSNVNWLKATYLYLHLFLLWQTPLTKLPCIYCWAQVQWEKRVIISTLFVLLPMEEVWDGNEGLFYVSSPYLKSALQERNGLYECFYQTHLNGCVMVLCFPLLILVSEVCKWSLAAAPAHLWPIQSAAVLTHRFCSVSVTQDHMVWLFSSLCLFLKIFMSDCSQTVSGTSTGLAWTYSLLPSHTCLPLNISHLTPPTQTT